MRRAVVRTIYYGITPFLAAIGAVWTVLTLTGVDSWWLSVLFTVGYAHALFALEKRHWRIVDSRSKMASGNIASDEVTPV